MRIVRCSRVGLVLILMASAVYASAIGPQIPGKQDQVVRVPENTPDAPVDKARLAQMKIELHQKELADDTAKLLVLANELKAEMDKSTKDTLSLGVVKKAEQVEKLAHKVREEMKASIAN